MELFAPAPFQPPCPREGRQTLMQLEHRVQGERLSLWPWESGCVHLQRSHCAALSLRAGPRSLLCVAFFPHSRLFPSLSHPSYIVDSEGRVMFQKVKHINAFLSTLMFRCAGEQRVAAWSWKGLTYPMHSLFLFFAKMIRGNPLFLPKCIALLHESSPVEMSWRSEKLLQFKCYHMNKAFWVALNCPDIFIALVVLKKT